LALTKTNKENRLQQARREKTRECFSACLNYDKSIKGRQYELAMCRGNTLINGVKPFSRRRNRREGSGSNKPIKEETS
jgi:hypothetical protein